MVMLAQTKCIWQSSHTSNVMQCRRLLNSNIRQACFLSCGWVLRALSRRVYWSLACFAGVCVDIVTEFSDCILERERVRIYAEREGDGGEEESRMIVTWFSKVVGVILLLRGAENGKFNWHVRFGCLETCLERKRLGSWNSCRCGSESVMVRDWEPHCDVLLTVWECDRWV